MCVMISVASLSYDSRQSSAELESIMNKVKDFFKKCVDFCKGLWDKFVVWFKKVTKNIQWKEVWDKCTTGLLILLMASPILILAYIFLWFILK